MIDKRQEPLKFGVVGLGNIAQAVHLPCIWFLESAELVSVCDIYESVARKVAKKYNVRSFVDCEEMLEKTDLDAIAICGPTATHTPLSIMALKKGINVLCEHPIACSVSQARTLVEAEAQSSARVMIAYMMRYGSDVRVVEELMLKGTIGDPYASCLTWFWSEHFPSYEKSVHARERAAMPESFIRPEKDEKPALDPFANPPDALPPVYMYSFGSHLVNLLRGLCGEVDDALSAFADLQELRFDGWTKVSGRQSSATIRHENGCISTIVISDGPRSSIDLLLQIQCTKGAVEISSEGLPYPRRNRKKTVRVHTEAGHMYPYLAPTYEYVEEHKHFISCLNTNSPFKTDSIDGMRTLEAIEKILKVAR